MNCESLLAIFNDEAACKKTDYGMRFVTHCLYPSFDPVSVYVSKLGSGYRVTDGGGAVRSAMVHGRDQHVMANAFGKACKRHSVVDREGMLIAEPKTDEWLYPAILAVANASAMAAGHAVEAIAEAVENDLKLQIGEILKQAVPESNVTKQYEYRGSSGNVWKMDYAVIRDSVLLIKSITPNRNSVNSNFSAFSDIGDEPNVSRYSVYKSPLKQTDTALIRRVAQLVPLASVEAGAQRVFSQRLG
jgi:hypothetical protein